VRNQVSNNKGDNLSAGTQLNQQQHESTFYLLAAASPLRHARPSP